jgi:hypothetical protein
MRIEGKIRKWLCYGYWEKLMASLITNILKWMVK